MDSETITVSNALDGRAWALCVLLTLCPALFAAWYANSPADLAPALAILPAWMAAAAILAAIGAFAHMVARKEPSPAAAIARMVQQDWRAILQAALLILLAGLNMITFMWIKPLLNQLVPFWADPLLALFDNALFFGHDPWTLLDWANVPFAGLIYHPVWFFTIAIALLVATFAPASRERSAIIVSYFVLWSLVAPIVHSLLPAVGPIFYEAMGYGPRFAAMQNNPETAAVAGYLWDFYESGSFGAGNGISAMPSMHVTTSSWVVIATYVLRRRWLPVALAAWAVIFTLSIALGWHYAVDGIVGAIAAFSVYRLCLLFFADRPGEPVSIAQPVPNPA
ncbi:phosphatase PAP2 family protein [Altererythrobacter arenosus]|uniref:Phosphatase PAP2 family protein n=1 Tax=Altererythrobacter arenosus TaxID=3032592 RepID=A0ABY8FT02_9SPHN|nr:phosphatase PAP2 family protein [Altererythrobacter sp. CAU 1644]WFL77210.1 phosphatase PAP2 family protein [Altererythrobacter sp. CAU 1644]